MFIVAENKVRVPTYVFLKIARKVKEDEILPFQFTREKLRLRCIFLLLFNEPRGDMINFLLWSKERKNCMRALRKTNSRDLIYIYDTRIKTSYSNGSAHQYDEFVTDHC